MTSEKFNGIFRAMSERLAGEPAHQAILRQLHVLLDSQHSSLPAIKLLGDLLVDAGRLDDARELYGELREHFHDEPQGFVGMAQVAMQKRAWREALACWDEVVARFSDRLTASWQGSHGTTLMELGRLDDAENIFRNLTQTFSNDFQGFVGLAQLAMLRGLWSDALLFWDEALDRFGDQAKLYWHAGRASTLCQLDRLDEAENIFLRLANDFATQSPGFVGLAEIAMRRHSWQEALARWDEVIAGFSSTANPYWLTARAHVLVELGREDEAEAIFRRAIEANPESKNGLLGLLRVLIAKGKTEEARFALNSSPLRFAGIPAVIERKFEILIWLRCLREARAEFERILPNAVEPAILNSLFAFVPRLYDGWRRRETWLILLGKADTLSARSDCKWKASVGALRARLLLALRNYDRFLAVVDEIPQPRDLGEHQQRLLAVASRLREPSFPDYAAPKIFGIGLPKTGTTSLAAALTTLGFNTLDWVNPLTRELLCDDDLHLFDAFTDSPVCMNFEKYYYMFPNSRFVYTTRPFESWKKSQTSHFARYYGYSEFKDLQKAMSQPGTFHFGADFININMSLYFNHADFEEAYRSYERRVRQFFQDKPQERFLKFDVSIGGWEKLCAFTGRAIPSTPFPWLNRKPSEASR